MYTRILVAVDGSNTSRRAFEAALDLAKSNNAVLQPFYVVENTPMYFEAPGYDPSVLRNRLVEQGKELGAEFAKAMIESGVKGDLARRCVCSRTERSGRLQGRLAGHGHAWQARFPAPDSR
jgi:nucleotide-binding universal stress UspA family protein